MADLIDRQVAIDMILEQTVCTTKKELVDRCDTHIEDENGWLGGVCVALDTIEDLPSAQPEQRYTEEELRVFQHGISLRLLSKRSAQHWRYDEDTATEIKFLERLYEKVGADMRGEQDE